MRKIRIDLCMYPLAILLVFVTSSVNAVIQEVSDEIRDHVERHQVSGRLVLAEADVAGRDLLWKLTKDQRQVIVLKYFEGWSNREVAESIEKPIGAVKSLQHRALRSLQRMLQEQDEVEKHEHA